MFIRRFLLFPLIFLSSQTIFSSDFSMVDSWAINAPDNLTDIESLTDYLANNNSFDDKDKARSFFMWIANNISIDVKALTTFNQGATDPQIVLSSKKSLSKGYANLFKVMCENSGIPCEVVDGYYKDHLYYPEKKFSSPNHSWNAVRINKKWHLIDISLASGTLQRKSSFVEKITSNIMGKNPINSEIIFEKKMNDTFFMTSPEIFVLSHLPVDPMWQLLHNPIDLNIFKLNNTEIATLSKNSSKETQFNFTDSISNYLGLPKDYRQKKLAIKAEQFNPNNYKTSAVAYASLGNELYIDARKSNTLKKRDKINQLKEASKLLKKAQGYYKSESAELTTSYKEIKTWQKTESKNRLRFYKSAIKVNEKLINKNKGDLDKISDRKKDISKKINLVHYDTYTYLDDESIMYIERPSEFISSEDSVKVQELYKTHRLNYDTVSLYINIIDSICSISNDDLHFSVKIDRSMVNDSTFHSINDFKEVINTLSMFNNENYYLLKNEHEMLAQRRQNILNMRDTIQAVERRGFRNNYSVIKDYRKKVKELTKTNKALLKDIKKINAHDSYEDQQFLEENDNYLRLSYMIIDRYYQEITEIKRESPTLKNQNKLLSQEIKILKKAINTETARYKKEAEVEKNRYQSERNISRSNLKKAKSLNTSCDKEIVKLRKS